MWQVYNVFEGNLLHIPIPHHAFWLVEGKMLVEQDRLSGDTVLWQNLGTMCQAPRRHLAIAIPFVPIYQISVQRDYNYYFPSNIPIPRIQLFLLRLQIVIAIVVHTTLLKSCEWKVILSGCDKVGPANTRGGEEVDWMSIEAKFWFVWSAKIFKLVFFSVFQVVQNVQIRFTVNVLALQKCC